MGQRGAAEMEPPAPGPAAEAPAGPHPFSAGFATLGTEHDYWIDELEGALPTALRGTLLRNGPGRNGSNGRWFPHWFDGDGMLSAITFDRGRVRYRNRYIQTPGYLKERAANRILYRGFGKMRPGGVLANAFRRPGNVANTSVVYHHQKLLALWEGGPATVIHPEDLTTVGLDRLECRDQAFSAHPKVDPRTGEMLNFGIDYGPRTSLQCYWIGRDGGLRRSTTITLPYPVMNHDFAITDHYLVFCLGPIRVHTLKLIAGLTSYDGALEWDGGRPTLILLVARDGAGEPQWLECAPFFQFHFANAFDHGAAITVDLARYPDYHAIGAVLRNFWRSEWPAANMAQLTRLVIDPGAGTVETRNLNAGTSTEFPQINGSYLGRQHRYVYVTAMPARRECGFAQLVSKVDCHTGVVTSHDFSPHGYAGEPIFVPYSDGDAEDDGCLITVVFNAAAGRSDVVLLDARDLAAKPLAVAHLRHHVPFGFHGCFTGELFGSGSSPKAK